ncbi:MAG TPA: type 1 glutamine amidotransferase [Hanamia sp.]|nr:type 1 glutamine amidotransferase [Hanamia sp.]
MKKLNIHYFQHAPYEGLGCIEEWAIQQGHTLTATKFFESSHILPDIQTIDALIVLGGPMSVYDELDYDWLATEKSFIKEAIDKEKRVLGICLGSQLIAACSGAGVSAAPNKEIGWFKIFPTEATKEISWLYDLLKEEPVAFHWHGDKFQIPAGSVNLTDSVANSNQLFMIKDKTLGIQFHLEVTHNSLLEMIKNGGVELNTTAPYIQSPKEILAGESFIKNNNRRMFKLLDNFLK